jgi:hypothetical protein
MVLSFVLGYPERDGDKQKSLALEARNRLAVKMKKAGSPQP